MILSFINELFNRHSNIKRTNFYYFIQQIIISLFLKYFSKFLKDDIDEKLIVMSAIGGSAFIGNTKYLFEYIYKNTDYKLVWLAKSKDLIIELKKKGYNCVPKFSLKAIKLLKKAKFIFTTHGILDVLPIEFSKNTIYVETWHGVQNKRNLTEHGPVKYSNSKIARLLRLNIINNNVFNYFITTSGTKKDIHLISKYFQISPRKVLATGYPRNDILFTKNNNYKEQIKKKYKIPDQTKKILLYAPTFRDFVYKAKFALSEKDLMKLNTLLIEKNAVLLAKAHMYEQSVEFKLYSNIFDVDKNSEIQELLIISNVLITDYSSVYCDFLLLNRPIIFFTYDFEEFMKNSRGFYYDFEKIAPGPLIFNSKSLLECIKNLDELDKKYESLRKEAQKIYHKHIDGNSTERLLKFLKII